MTFLETIRRAIDEECLMVLRIDVDREERAMELFTHYSDKNFSVVDCTSFVIMQDRRLQHVLRVDDHFTQMGFILGPPFPSFPFEN